MSLAYWSSTQPDPDGVHPAPRTLRDAAHDPLDWIEGPHRTRAANATWLVISDLNVPARPVLDAHTLGLALRIAGATLMALAMAALVVLALLELLRA